MNCCRKDMRPLIHEFEYPSEEFAPIPFWFWNDTLTEEELCRQICAFKEKGVDGFVIHARMGLDPDIPYMGEKWLYFVRHAVELAEKKNMKVILYDEAMYPSGSCAGQVVAENPDFCAKGLRVSESPDVCESEKMIAQAEIDGVMIYFIQIPTRGVIRGAYFGQDDFEENAPAAADLLNPLAVEAFIRLTHQRYYDALSEHFGKTIIAIFTDEPSLLGRGPVQTIVPWTNDFLKDFLALGYAEKDILALFDDTVHDAMQIRSNFRQALFDRMNRTYYGQIAAWCNAHNIALTGHPAESDDIHLLSHFGIPCQDIVWRMLAPDEPTNISGKTVQWANALRIAPDTAGNDGTATNALACADIRTIPTPSTGPI